MNILESFFENIKQKFTNPFFGTLILVWLSRNWSIVYSVFNFDKDCTLDDKKIIINDYFKQLDFWEEFGINISFAFFFMIIGYILIIITRFIVELVETNITPTIRVWARSKKIVTKETYDLLLEESKTVYQKLIDERENVGRLETSFLKLESEIVQLRNDNKNLKELYATSQQLTDKKETEVDNLLKDRKTLKEENEFLRTDYQRNMKRFKIAYSLAKIQEISYEITEAFLDLMENNIKLAFEKIYISVSKKESKNDWNKDIIDKLIELRFIEFKNDEIIYSDRYHNNNLKMTELADNVYEKIDVIATEYSLH
jgi:hypothetical protein